jgi:hypothetical protein
VRGFISGRNAVRKACSMRLEKNYCDKIKMSYGEVGLLSPTVGIARNSQSVRLLGGRGSRDAV